jgi:nucleotide-binding universal stress UspA family protein
VNTKSILVPVNGDRAGESAFRLACRLARESKAKLHAVHVIEVNHELPLDAEVDPSHAERALDRIETLSREEKYKVEAQCLQARSAGPAIVEEASQRGAELIVVGIGYKHRMGRFTVGETASYLLGNAHCPVILWREVDGVNSRHEIRSLVR